YPGVQALDCIDLQIKQGEIHALLGQNGAGKSTLIRMLSGVERPDSGAIEMHGAALNLKTPMDSQKAGIFTIFQELSLVTELSVAENIFLSDLPTNSLGIVDWNTVKARASEIMDWIGFPIDVDQSVKHLSVAQKQGVELAKALHHNAEVILLDEPSAALPQPDVKRLFEILQNLKEAGLAIVYISHRLEEVQELCDFATVLRDGKKVESYNILDTDTSELVRAMVGRNVTSSLLGEALAGVGRPRIGNGNKGKVVMSVDCISDGTFIHDVSFDLHAGEVLGITGLLGNGQPELAGCLFGDRRLSSGSIIILDKKIKRSSPKAIIDAGVGFLPEERKTQGLILGMSIEHNMTLASQRQFSKGSIIDQRKEKIVVGKMMKSLRIKATGPSQIVGTLSGGNQQKVVLAKWLISKSKILVFSEPTRGIDVGTKEEIYQLIRSFASEGGAAIVISSEIPEAIMCDKVFVMSKGTFVGNLEFHEIDVHGDAILKYCCN
ncbi:MAG: sugar ABC transporter ATP-binding protein, partial [Peptostreptococcaceae bacterium]|nr:sugar ABC transporter ATP-binding protein [Peptostreptococcaceae bacterium]